VIPLGVVKVGVVLDVVEMWYAHQVEGKGKTTVTSDCNWQVSHYPPYN